MHFAIFHWLLNLKQKQEKSYSTSSLFLNFLKQFDWGADSAKTLKMDFLPIAHIFPHRECPSPSGPPALEWARTSQPAPCITGLQAPAPFPSAQAHF